MPNAILFLLGFSSVVGVYEIAKTTKRNNTNRLEKTVSIYRKFLK